MLLRPRARPSEHVQRKQSPNLYSHLDAATGADIAYGAEPVRAKRPVEGQERGMNPHQAVTASVADKTWPLQSGPQAGCPVT